jgi:hypothetical protein
MQFVSELLYKEEVFQLVGLCMEIHRELGKGHDEVIYKERSRCRTDSRWNSLFPREKLRNHLQGSHPASLLLRGLRCLR